MNDYLKYKGYSGTVEYSSADNILHGEVVGIKGLITYHGDNIENLKRDFEDAVDHYLTDCTESGVKPQEPFYDIHGANNPA